YWPTIGLFVALVWGANQLLSTSAFLLRWRLFPAAIAILMFGAVTSHQLEYWQNTEKLFEHTRRVTQRNWLAELILGTLRERENRLDEAERCLRKSIEYLAEDGEIRASVRGQLVRMLLRRGDEAAAIDELKEAMAERPNEAWPHQQLADILSTDGRYPEAILQYNDALRLRPGDAGLHLRLAKAFDSSGSLDQAASQLAEVTRLTPRDATEHHALGTVYFRRGRMDDAINEFRQALSLRPSLEVARLDLIKAIERRNGAEVPSR